MPVNDQLEGVIRALLTDQPIAYHPMVAEAVGSVLAGVLLSQLLYWTPRTPDGWLYKTREELKAETALTRWEQETARKQLRDLGVLLEERRGMPARVHFRVDLGRLVELLASHDKPRREKANNLPAAQSVEDQPSSRLNFNQQAPQPVEVQPPSRLKPNRQGGGVSTTKPVDPQPAALLVTETTTEIDPEISTDTTASKSSKERSELEKVITEVSKTLRDLPHVRSNRTRAVNLGEQYGLDEYAMVRLCQAALETVKPRAQQLERPMAYFFETLEDRCKSAPGARSSLAGRYWRLVQR